MRVVELPWAGVALALCVSWPLVSSADGAILSIADRAAGQGNEPTQALEFQVTRTGDTSYPVVVAYETIADPDAANPAESGTDYVASSGEVGIATGEASATLMVTLLRRPAGEPERSFLLRLTDPRGEGFASEKIFPASGLPNAVAVGDLNADGALDVVLANNTDGTVSVFLNARTPGALSFGAEQRFAAGSLNERGLAIADFNGDGRADVAVSNGSDNTVAVLANSTPSGSGSVSFAPPQIVSSGGSAPAAIVAADFNLDGRPDLAIAHESDGTVGLLRNTTVSSTPAFVADESMDAGPNAFGIAAADLNVDGRPDLVVGGGTAETIVTFINTSPGADQIAFIEAQDFVMFGLCCVIATGDFNGDGRADIATASSNTLRILANRTEAGAPWVRVWEDVVLPTRSVPRSMAVADMDDDGLVDIVVAANSAPNTVQIFRNVKLADDDTIRMAAQSAIFVAEGGNPSSVVIGDVDGTGSADVVIASNTNDANQFGALLAARTTVSVAPSLARGTIHATVQPFSFPAVVDAPRSAAVVSDEVDIGQLAYDVPISVSGGEYSINGGPFTALDGTLVSRDRVQLRVMTPPAPETEVMATIMIGGVSEPFSVRTAAQAGGGAMPGLSLPLLLLAAWRWRRLRGQALSV